MVKSGMDNCIWDHFFYMMVNQKRKFKDIRVREICEEANIHRSTFYRHFEDKYQLLEFGLFILWNDFFELDEREKFYAPFKTADDFYEKSEAEQLINKNQSDELFFETVNRFFLKQMTASFKAILKEDSQNKLPTDLMVKYVVGSIQALDEWSREQENVTSEALDCYYKTLVLDVLDLECSK
ncbi:TetR/AcrR family transcriptional regulator [Vagococcus carniphilus]|uniref:TetR/AcrR family transcriptional regulator n=1 Tax=Vagococcus carniphilus TaxID=218144 RepID=A0AAW8U7J3_9ENTE|nr:TetR/AcrR family transcriptional regulator [Vagococcus carniphilus]MDT2834150.1 TetR/AcrR family transcriptional regulator [Vagococcus carniphilus]